MDTVIIKNLNGGYESTDVIHDISLQIQDGKMTAIIGPNGSGKTTILKYLIKELSKNNDCIFIENKPINSYEQIKLAREISLVPQNSRQEYEFTVKELVSMGRYCHNDIETNNNEINKALKTVGIENIQTKLITEISGGELQLAMLARAICQDTQIIVLDEPTNNLDPKHTLKMLEILTKLKSQNKTVICVIHDLNAVLRFFDNVILMKDGKIYDTGTVAQVITEENINKVYDIKSKIIPANDQLPTVIVYNF